MALFAGAAVFVAGFTVGGLLVATANGGSAQNNAGWVVMESAFAVAPTAAHGAAGEWARGLAFTALPAASVGCTAAVFSIDPGAVTHGALPEQRWLWSFYGVALAGGITGVVDALFADARAPALAIVPTAGVGRFGLALQGAL